MDGAGDAFVVGVTNSTDFTRSNAFQPILAGGTDAFVTSIQANGHIFSPRTSVARRMTRGLEIAVNPLTGEATVVAALVE